MPSSTTFSPLASARPLPAASERSGLGAVTPPPVAATAGRSAPKAPAWPAPLDLLLESAGDGIFGVDLDGRCNFINRAAAEMIGHPAAAVIGCNMHALIHHRHADGSPYPEADCPIFNAFREGRACRIDSEVLWRADGSAFDAEYSSQPVVDAGVVQGAVVTLVDISQRKRAEAERRAAHGELERRVAERTLELSDALERLRDLSAWLETVREQERTRIAREIHDELGSLLVALRMDVNWVGARVDDRPPLAAKCGRMGQLIDAAVDNLGRIITDLRPSILDHQGLWAALEWQAQEFVEASGLQADVRFHVAAGTAPPAGERGERWSIAVFRIFQEMLSNVARHARAGRLRIRLYVDAPPDAVLHLEVVDDGIGAAAAALARPQAHGVMGMRERAGHYGGTLAIESAPGHGTRLRLAMPFPADEAAAATATPTATPNGPS